MPLSLGPTLVDESDDDMARRRSKVSEVNESLVASYLKALRSAGTVAAFKDVYDILVSDPELKSSDLIAISNRYAVGGIKATNRMGALDRIRKRNVELRRNKGDLEIAGKARPW